MKKFALFDAEGTLLDSDGTAFGDVAEIMPLVTEWGWSCALLSALPEDEIRAALGERSGAFPLFFRGRPTVNTLGAAASAMGAEPTALTLVTARRDAETAADAAGCQLLIVDRTEGRGACDMRDVFAQLERVCFM